MQEKSKEPFIIVVKRGNMETTNQGLQDLDKSKATIMEDTLKAIMEIKIGVNTIKITLPTFKGSSDPKEYLNGCLK